MILDFVTTAMRRPDVIIRTYRSFLTNLRDVDFARSTLYLNIDPLPADGSAYLVAEIARTAFGNVVVHTPPEASFPAAVKWCWQQPTTPYFFSIEDDWLLAAPVSVLDLARQLDADEWLSCVNLRAYQFPGGDSRICLSPCLMRTAHAKVMADRLTLNANPEKQLRPIAHDNAHGNRHAGFRGVQFPDEPVIFDIGRGWLARSGCAKEIDVHFTKWVQKQEATP